LPPAGSEPTRSRSQRIALDQQVTRCAKLPLSGGNGLAGIGRGPIGRIRIIT